MGMDIRAEYAAGRRDFRNEDLSGAVLRGANLSEADLSGANLRGTCLDGAILTDTCLDPAAQHTPPTDAELSAAGLDYEGDYVYGWRTSTSKYCGNTEYIVGQEYTSHAFSTDSGTECHPGLYLAGRGWLRENGYSCDVRVACRRRDLLKAGDKFRCRSFRVVGDAQARFAALGRGLARPSTYGA